MNEARRAAAMLYVWPAGLADGGHVEAVAALDECLFSGAKGVSERGTLLHALVLSPAAMFKLVIFDAGSEG
jgi:hypothetical protein